MSDRSRASNSTPALCAERQAVLSDLSRLSDNTCLSSTLWPERQLAQRDQSRFDDDLEALSETLWQESVEEAIWNVTVRPAWFTSTESQELFGDSKDNILGQCSL